MYVDVIWDLEDDPEGNYWHIVVEGHDVTQEEVVEILSDANNQTTFSRSSGQAITFGWTSTAKYWPWFGKKWRATIELPTDYGLSHKSTKRFRIAHEQPKRKAPG